MADRREQETSGIAESLPLDHLKDAAQDLLTALVERAVGSAGKQVEQLTERLTGYAGDGGGPGLMAAVTGGKKLAEGGGPLKAALGAGTEAVKQAVGGGGGGGGGSSGGSAKVVNIIEQNDVGLPLRVVYDQWTLLEDFPGFTRKVETVEQESDEEVNWRAQIFLSHRSWQSTILEQVPDSRIVWKSTGSKGSVDGTVSFHELTPTLTRILLVLEYHPQGFFEKTANLWRAQGRRVRSDFKHIKRHMMTRTILEQDEIEGWRGEIRDREVVRSHDDAVAAEDEGSEGAGRDEYRDEDEYPEDDAYRDDEYSDYEDRDGESRGGASRERTDEDYADRYSDEEYGDDEDEPAPTPRRSRMRARRSR